MADIIYNPTFSHEDWIDNEDVVQAGGEKGFNKKFHEIEDEFDNMQAVVAEIDAELKKTKQLTLIKSFTVPNLAPGAIHKEQIDDYATDSIPGGVRKVYFPTINQSDPMNPKEFIHFFNYKASPTTTIVDMHIKNTDSSPITLTVHVLAFI